jgi:AcrR family transcriptional regulator
VKGSRQAPSGRYKQRARTKTWLLQAAGKLLQSGLVPSVSEVADMAEVSRRTAYRYFPTQEQLLAEAALEELRPVVLEAFEGALPGDAELRIELLTREVQRLAYQYEGVLQTILRLSLERRLGAERQTAVVQGARRGVRRISWIETALEPVRKRLGNRKFQRLVSALSMVIGIEALLVLRDIRGLSQEESIETSVWAARELLKAALNSRPRTKPC